MIPGQESTVKSNCSQWWDEWRKVWRLEANTLDADFQNKQTKKQYLDIWNQIDASCVQTTLTNSPSFMMSEKIVKWEITSLSMKKAIEKMTRPCSQWLSMLRQCQGKFCKAGLFPPHFGNKKKMTLVLSSYGFVSLENLNEVVSLVVPNNWDCITWICSIFSQSWFLTQIVILALPCFCLFVWNMLF